MSFFGLTAIGDQAPFRSNTKGGTNIGLFDEHDVSTAFDRAAKGDTLLAADKIPLFFDELYHGPHYPAVEHECARRTFVGDAMDKDSFRLTVVAAIRANCCAGPQRELAAEFNSNTKLRECANKNMRRTHGPSEAFDRAGVPRRALAPHLRCSAVATI